MASKSNGSAKWGKRNKRNSSAKARRADGGSELSDLWDDPEFLEWQNRR